MSLSREHKENIKQEYLDPLFEELSPATMGFSVRYSGFVNKLALYMTSLSKTTRAEFEREFAKENSAIKNFFALYLFKDEYRKTWYYFHTAIQTYLRESIVEFYLKYNYSHDSLHRLKDEVQANENNFYVVGEPVTTTFLKKNFLRSHYRYFSSIDPYTLRDTFDGIPEGKVRLFKNLYQALEYLAFTSPKIQLSTETTPSVVRSLWAVRCRDETHHLGSEEYITLNEHSTDERVAGIEYIEVEKKHIQPLLGTVLKNLDENGLYYVTLNLTDMRELIVEEKPKETCRLM